MQQQELAGDKKETKKPRMRRLDVVSLQIVKEKTYPYKTHTIRQPSDVHDLLVEYIGNEDREHAVLLCLDTKQKITSIQTIAIGSLNAAIIAPREVFKLAVLSNSASIILGHCHPSQDDSCGGAPAPSPEDIEITNRLKTVGELLGIELLDHLVCNAHKCYSLKQNGLM
jgi:DNA repair protein RadC